jgi:hypothetical protein
MEIGSPAARLQRELKTVHQMILLSCRSRHGGGGSLCETCDELWRYAQARVERCPFHQDKPTCAQCTIHCYKPSMRERIKDVMRYAGPRMIWRHPLLAIGHILDKRRPAPERPPRK